MWRVRIRFWFARSISALSLGIVFVVATPACAPQSTSRPAEPPALPMAAAEPLPPSRSGTRRALHALPGATPAYRVERAVEPDPAYGTPGRVPARRYVYRVKMSVPGQFGLRADPIALPAAELVVDANHERLRARFVGPAWPFASTAEVRMRQDRSGVFVFDAYGGRPLRAGELASWFEGGRVTRRGPALRILHPYGYRPSPRRRDDAAYLLCALLAEWSDEAREAVLRRCERRGSPSRFRIGLWKAERTAVIPLELERTRLRADHADPPAAPRQVSGRAFLERDALAKIVAHRRLRAVRAEPGHSGLEPVHGGRVDLRVENQSATRAIIAVQGVAIGWVDAHSRTEFSAFAPGVYTIGALRPLGAVAQPGRAMRVPTLFRICSGRCTRPAGQARGHALGNQGRLSGAAASALPR